MFKNISTSDSSDRSSFFHHITYIFLFLIICSDTLVFFLFVIEANHVIVTVTLSGPKDFQ